jgi:hypothetical protein
MWLSIAYAVGFGLKTCNAASFADLADVALSLFLTGFCLLWALAFGLVSRRVRKANWGSHPN